MPGSAIDDAGNVLVSAINAACTGAFSAAEMIDAYRETGAVEDRVKAAHVMAGDLLRLGVFTDHGYTRPEYAIADLREGRLTVASASDSSDGALEVASRAELLERCGGQRPTGRTLDELAAGLESAVRAIGG